MITSKLYQAAEKAVKNSLRLRRGERFLLVTDKEKMEIAEAVAYWAKQVGAETTTYLMTETLRPVTEPTSLFKQLAIRATVIVYMLESRIEEKPFRFYMVDVGMKRSRVCMMPGLTTDMMERLVNIDFKEMTALSKKVVKALEDADDVLVENKEGTRVEFSVRGRRWNIDQGDISRKGKHGNLPCGECYTAPVEDTFNGKLVISLIDNILGRGVLEFERGRLVRAKGKGVESVIKNIGNDETGKMIGEFGIGTNKHARICPNMLEAEKAFSTAHFALGDSYGLGKNRSKHHYDVLIDKVTIRAKGKFIIKDGKFSV